MADIEIISTSGGRTSMYLSILKRAENPESINIFMDTGAEHPKTYDFLRKCNEHFNLGIICIKAVIDPMLGVGVRHQVVDINTLKHDNGVMADYMVKNGTPVSVGATCSDRMKTLAFRSWLGGFISKKEALNHFIHEEAEASEIDPERITTWLGMRIDEPRRLKYPKGVRYLADISDYTKEDVMEFWEGQPFDLGIPEHLGNCVFCVKKSPIKIALAARHEPGMAELWRALIYSDNTRVMPNRADAQDVMYRDYMTFNQIVESFKSFPTEELEKRVGLHRDDSACSSSCDGDFSIKFLKKETQPDLFKSYEIKQS